LHAREAVAEIEDQVAALPMGKRQVHADPELDRRVDDRRLRDRALLVGRQLHVLKVENASDDVVVRPGYAVAAASSFGTSSQSSSRR
jgi:hypothetical protein